ncbi:hypothetical protein PINS_up001318 [Pythium insidiosum]|nr:hypothetical protein PINS_up001318 [Pythium insidiosum]
MNSSTTAPTSCAMSSHQAIMKCPWQWRQPFLDEKRESRKRKVADGHFCDPVDPSFVDQLLPGHAKKFCPQLIESDEKEMIQQEIERLMTKTREDHEVLSLLDPLIREAAIVARESHAKRCDEQPCDDEASTENLALVDSILMLSKAVEDVSHTSSLLASPLSVSSPFSDEDDSDSGASSGDEAALDEVEFQLGGRVEQVSQSPPLQLMTDTHENFFAVEDDYLLEFDGEKSSHDAAD